MSFLKRIFSQPEHPAWADFLSQSDLIEFSKNLTEVLDRHAAPYNLNLQEGYWRPEGDEDKTYGIMNMAQTWRQIDPADRKGYLDHFVQTILKMTTGELEQPSFEDVKEQLRVRLYPKDGLPDFQADIDLKICDAFVTLLAIDLPETIQSVTPDQIKNWGYMGREKELLDIALDQVWRQESVSVSGHQLPGGISIRSISGDSFFTASHALLLDRYLVPANPIGALVVIPNRHSFVFYSIESPAGLGEAINVFFPMAQGMFAEGPGSITPELLWWREGTFTIVPTKVENNTLTVDLPEQLLELLQVE